MSKKNTKEISVKIEGAEWEGFIHKVYEKQKGKIKVDGFRPGKAPKDIVMKKYKDSFLMDAADLCIDEAYTKAIDENKDLELVAQPQLNLKSLTEEGVEFDIVLTLKPELKLGKYKNLGIKKEEITVTEQEIEDAIDHLRTHYAEDVVKEGAVENKDKAIIDFEGFVDGVAFDGGKAENYTLEIGSGMFIPGFEEQLIGMNKGEEKEIEVTFPDNYHSEDLKGKKATFKVKINDIKTTKVPELDQDFFEDLGYEGIHSKEALVEQVKENIRTQKENDAENKYMDSLLEEAAKEVEVDLPEAMVEEEINRMMNQYEEHLKMQGITLEMFFQFTNSDETALREQMKEEATKRITFRLMLEEIAKVENIKVTDQEVEEEADKLALRYQMDKEEFLNAFGGLDMIRYDLEMRSALNVLKG